MSSRSSSRSVRHSRCAASLAALALFPLLAGCMHMQVPKDFLVIEEGSSEIKAVSPDDAKIWVHEFSDPDEGDLAFWSSVLKTDFVENRGYTLLEERAVKIAAGREGMEYRFEVTTQGTAQGYLVQVSVLEGWLSNTIVAVEFVAPKQVFAKHLDEVRKAIATLDP